MDIMDNVYSGKYKGTISIEDSMGWSKTLPDGTYVRASKLKFQREKKDIMDVVEKDLLAEMELTGDARATRIFRTVWEHSSLYGVSKVVSLFRELMQAVE